MIHKGVKNYVILFTVIGCCLLATHTVEGKRLFGSSNKKTSGNSSRQPSSNSGHVTKPSYPTNSGSQSDLAKLSYSNTHTQPNHSPVGGGSNNGHYPNQAPSYGWNVQNKPQGPPPAYSASNPVGGAKSNIHEPPPSYQMNNHAAPPSYGSSNVHTPIQATHTQGVHSSYPGSVPAGATYYPSAGHVPAGSNYYYPPGGHLPPGASYYPAAHAPAGATYLPAGAALPVGATYYSQPPQSSSSGLGFGSGLAAGAIGGALLGHALTPTQTRVIEQAPASNAGGSGGSDRIIIINNGQPVNVTEAGSGTTVINAGGATNPQQQSPVPVADTPTAQLAPMAPLNNTNPPAPMDPAAAQPAPTPAPGGIICVPVRVNETDPADATKMIEIEKIACYPAPPPQPEQMPPANNMNVQPPMANDGSVPLAPMNAMPNQGSQQQQQQTPLLPEQSKVHQNNGGISISHSFMGVWLSSVLSLLIAYSMQ